MTPQRVVAIIESHQFRLEDEKFLQAQVSTMLASYGADVLREVRLDDLGIIDMVVGDGLGLEIKIRAPRRAIYRQCERYCQSPRITSLVLATCTAMGMPPEIGGKPVFIANLAKGWQ